VPSGPTAIPPEQKPAEAKPEDQKDEAWWRARIAQAREGQRRSEAFAAEFLLPAEAIDVGAG